MGTTEQIPRDVETFTATLDAVGYPVGSDRVSAFMALPEHIRERVFADVKSGEGVPVVATKEHSS